ncbi:MAG: hypothetical protein M1827_000684 [Pycnora praestabilis]|nr:MAG: hypothetical protein M1827_000684 [Pycnora praestabilis]
MKNAESRARDVFRHPKVKVFPNFKAQSNEAIWGKDSEPEYATEAETGMRSARLASSMSMEFAGSTGLCELWEALGYYIAWLLKNEGSRFGNATRTEPPSWEKADAPPIQRMERKLSAQ